MDMMDLFCNVGRIFAEEAGVVSISPISTIKVGVIEYAMKFTKLAEI